MTNNAKVIADLIVRWKDELGRHPPWRKTSDPYELAAAEILLQKTKASDVVHVWLDLLARFPSASSLAHATDGSVREVVGRLGLGTQRTLRLKAMATALASEEVPDKIPGLGPYGAAIAALTGAREPVGPPIDGNVARVVVRVKGLNFDRGEPRKKPEVREAVACLLSTCRSQSEKLEVIYGLVDLGATVCTPRHPRHSDCPLLTFCASRDL